MPEFKKLPGSAASGLSDSEIEHLMDLEDCLADIVFDSWLLCYKSNIETILRVDNAPDERNTATCFCADWAQTRT